MSVVNNPVLPAGQGLESIPPKLAMNWSTRCVGHALLTLALSASLCSSQCLSGWTLYEDIIGLEMHDSCLAAFTSSPTAQYSSLSASCASYGGHLLTSNSYTSIYSGILSTASTLIPGNASAIIGCHQLSTAVARGAGWVWIDGTDALNINPRDPNDGFSGGDGDGVWAFEQPNDGGLNGTLELHIEDTCALYPNGTINDVNFTAFAASGNISYICEIDLQCPGGWIRYIDDGSEGHDSCLFLPKLSARTVAIANTWATALSSNPIGSHLLTVSSPVYSPNSAMSLALNATIANHPASFVPDRAWVGCTQSSSSGWVWIDGTPASNLQHSTVGPQGWWATNITSSTFGVSVCMVNLVNSSLPTGYHIGQLLGVASVNVVNGLPMIVERDISPTLCPPGWTYYQDRGTEGVDSCLYIPMLQTLVTPGIRSWTNEARICPTGSHLLSVRSSSTKSGLLPFATSLTPNAMFIGCFQTGSSWYWFDGTSPANMNASTCGASPCNIWSAVNTLGPTDDDDYHYDPLDASLNRPINVSCTIMNSLNRYTDDYNTPAAFHPSQYQPVCEMEVSTRCPFGWAYYVDDGSEGVDSCVQISSYVVSNWTMASQSCPAGSHLLTSRASRPSALLTFAFALSADMLSPDFPTTSYSNPFIGCSQAANATQRAAGWSWVDGTNASNLNCGGGNGGNGCGAWYPGSPDDWGGNGVEGHFEDYCELWVLGSPFPGITDGSAQSAYRFVCEMELPSPSPTPSVSPSMTASSTATVTLSPSASPSPICPPNWTYYADVDGSEGHDSCIAVFATASSTTGLSALSTGTSCQDKGGHLLTLLGSDPKGGLSALATLLPRSRSTVIGCYQSPTAVAKGMGWQWVEGTNAANINCAPYTGDGGCGLWASNQPDDGDFNRSTELHVEDGCGLMLNGSINDISLSFPTNTPYMCEIDLQCPGRWTYYMDDGSEGHDSCVTVPISSDTNSAALYPGWLSASQAVPAGSHLLTTLSSWNSSLSAFALSTFASEIPGVASADFAWCGSVQSPSASDINSSWLWVDGTPNNNLNCGGNGCGIWASGFPSINPFHQSVGFLLLDKGLSDANVGAMFSVGIRDNSWNFPSIIERDISLTLCPPGWTYYQDNGTEGVDSCLKFPTGNPSVVWYKSVSVCPVGSHPLSIRSSSNADGLLPFAASLAPSAVFIGCYQDHLLTWRWWDGTPATNLNETGCSGSTCPILSTLSFITSSGEDDDPYQQLGGYCYIPAADTRYNLDISWAPAVAPTICETEVSPRCPFGWAYYVDDGSEGADSCVQLSSYVVSNWTMASQSCPAGSHLLTSRASRPSALLSFAFSIGASLFFDSSSQPYIGCSQAKNTTQRAAGWSWVDGTNASNLNCGGGNGGDGCGAWHIWEPDDAPGSSEQHIEDYGCLMSWETALPGVNDCAWEKPSFFICEMELPTPSPSPTPSASVTPTPTISVTPSHSASPSPICPPNWTYYADVDGSEGHDSCVSVFLTATNTTGLSALRSSCQGHGGHLLTILGSDPNGGLVALATSLPRSRSTVIGCYQSPTAVAKEMGWQWVDGTNAANINCVPNTGSSQCQLWASKQPDDGGFNRSTELHVEDGCGLMLNGSINDISLSFPSNTPYMCEIDLQCPGRWTYYMDDGSEGHDSCVTVPISSDTNSAALYPGWQSAVNAVPPGSHLLTTRTSSNSSLSALVLSTFAGDIPGVLSAGFTWCGSVQSPSASDINSSWLWVDGTPNSNLNCGGNGCGVWAPEFPSINPFSQSVGFMLLDEGLSDANVGAVFSVSIADDSWNFPSVIERDISPTLCPPGWTYYQDNGTEGVDSCLCIPRVNQSSWLHSVGICPVGSHMLSIRSSSNASGLLPFAASLTPSAVFVGCYKDYFPTWRWWDGTPATNLNETGCSGSACPIWSTLSFKAASGKDDDPYQRLGGYCYIPAADARYNFNVDSPPTAMSTICETEVSPRCPFGWSYYVDDGSEGADSCVQISSYMVSNWTMASQSCPIGSHLLTVRAQRPSALMSFAFSIGSSLFFTADSEPFIGCSQAKNATHRAAGWSWIDGTNASNLNCGGGNGGDGCGAWYSDGQPDDAGLSEQHKQDYCSLLSWDTAIPGLDDCAWQIPSWFICEMELPTPSPSPTPSPTVTPSISTSKSFTPTVSYSSSITPTPSPAYPVNAPIVHHITYVTGDWSVCSARCDGWSFRSVTCLVDGAVDDDGSACAGAGLVAPSQLQQCNTGLCPSSGFVGNASYSWTSDPWSPCSSPCMNGSDVSLGIAVRNVTCRDAANAIVDSALCVNANLTIPSNTTACNRFPCPNTVCAWSVSAWSLCQSSIGCGVGNQSRTVTCRNSGGSAVSASNCVGSAPNTTQQCDTGVTCGCTTDSDCSSVSVNSQCDVSSGKCVCKSGWIGVGCDVIQLLGNSSTSSCSGVLDAAGKCCAGTIDSVTGVCCGSGIITDAQGRCCDGVLDVCGVCNGTGVSVDRNGVCCDTPLSASGVCCGFDDCAVCGGLSACPALSQFTFVNTGGARRQLSSTKAALRSIPSLAELLGVSSSLITDFSYVNVTTVGQNESVLTFSVSAEANIATSTLVSAVASTSVSLLGINVTRVAVCPNQHCEVGEACVDVTCSTGCPADCPAYQGNCPLGLSADGNVTVCSSNGRCLQGTAQCVCHAGYSGNACSGCAAEYIRIVRGGPCIYLPGSQVSCHDGVKDGNELGVDCGGPNCSPCPMPSQPTLVIVVVSVSVVSVVTSLLVILKRRGRPAVSVKEEKGKEKGKARRKRSSVVVPVVKHVRPSRASVDSTGESEEVREATTADVN